MTQLVQVGDAHLVAEHRAVALGEIPEVFQEENNLRRHRLILVKLGPVGGPGEQPEDIVLEAFIEEIPSRQRLVVDGDGGGQSAQRSGKFFLRLFHDRRGEGGELNERHAMKPM